MPDSDVLRRSTGDISSSGTTQTDPSIGSADSPEGRNKTADMPAADNEKTSSQARVYNDGDNDNDASESRFEKQGQQQQQCQQGIEAVST